MPEGFTAISVTPEARDRLRALSFALTGRMQKRVSMSAAILAAVAVAENHPDEMDSALNPNGESE
ncbi:hypothetical protein [Actinoallomurus iriomotensis]|uniref:Uncharacterized protein n=1 Tax=Actinoallomurus iriomotensis TaxID=478107 RepID=A0A9W6VWX9_9ACTN|nr:hypothetical protein [Actinoallomurus iriomotensis]GLY82057.1 hypothetical protein Airi01_103240 [Actinoallomurus iriomotensis]